MSDETKKSSSKSDEFKKILEKNLIKLPKVGDTIKGAVLSVSKREIHVDIDGVTTGLARGKEIIDESGEYSDLKPGDKVEAYVLELENEKGEIELSLRQAGHQKAWDNLRKLFEKKEKINVQVIDANKGGLIVLVGKTRGFLPVSQLSAKNYPRVSSGDKSKILDKLKSFSGQSFNVEIIGLDEKEEKLIVSEKQAVQEQQEKEISKYKIGDIVEGVIAAITDFGAFIKFDSLEGLIHISELAWQRIDHPRDVVKLGETVKAQIIEINGTKIFLSIKKIADDPWTDINKKYKTGDIVKGTVLKINPFGLFVELDKDIHGLAHISELANENIKDLKTFAKTGEERDFKILSIDINTHRLGLSIKALEEKSKPKTEKQADDKKTEGKGDKKEDEEIKKDKEEEK
ncbi:S1 RNA-binding domain-containing protein [Candidatus Falkowbacteria bacterium]|jgi:small subunit ribosomal protein S1|nr:S1 RNA-binding domain-containing protein [Candidatus Falkowbacteria bacterium]MBT4433195.1 S1 RNA-binding domain-containing protein [Candidatus Falkowbacteria bacterium]